MTQKKVRYLEVSIREGGVVRNELVASVNEAIKKYGISRVTVNRSIKETDPDKQWVRNGTMRFRWTQRKAKVTNDSCQAVRATIEADGVSVVIDYPSLTDAKNRWRVSRHVIMDSVEKEAAADISAFHQVRFALIDEVEKPTIEKEKENIIGYIKIQTLRGRNVITLQELIGYGIMGSRFLPRSEAIKQLEQEERIKFIDGLHKIQLGIKGE